MLTLSRFIAQSRKGVKSFRLRPSSEALQILYAPLVKEWPRLPFTARIGRAQFHCTRPANKKGTWPLLPHPSEGSALREQRKLLTPLRPTFGGRTLREHRRSSDSIPSSRGAIREERVLVGTRRLLAEAWKRFVKPDASGSLSLEALMALKMAGRSTTPLRR